MLAKFVNAGQVADITALVDAEDFAAEKAAIAPFTWDVTSFDGKTYGVGALGAAFGIFSNIDLLEAAGITEFPQTRDELVEAAKALDHRSGLGLPVPRLLPRLRALGLVPVRPQR